MPGSRGSTDSIALRALACLLASPTLCVLTTVCIYVRFTLAKGGLHPYVWCSLVHARLLIETHTRAGNFRFACNLAIDDERRLTRRLIITKKREERRRLPLQQDKY